MHKARKQALRYAMTGIAVPCLGAVFAAPMTIAPKAKASRGQGGCANDAIRNRDQFEGLAAGEINTNI
jgi:hypothetical protein